MPNLTVTLSDAQWTAYQAVSGDISLADASAWLKRQLTTDYVTKLEGVDQDAATSTEATAKGTRDTKIAAFEA
jgi:hypothetical protein